MVHLYHQLHITILPLYHEQHGIGISIGLVSGVGNGVACVVFHDINMLASELLLHLILSGCINQRIAFQRAIHRLRVFADDLERKLILAIKKSHSGFIAI